MIIRQGDRLRGKSPVTADKTGSRMFFGIKSRIGIGRIPVVIRRISKRIDGDQAGGNAARKYKQKGGCNNNRPDETETSEGLVQESADQRRKHHLPDPAYYR